MVADPIATNRCQALTRRALVPVLILFAIAVALTSGGRDVFADHTANILSVDGKIDTEKYPDGASFDRDALFALGPEKLETETHFTKGLQRFEGVRLSALLDAVGADGTILTASGLDGYSVDIPIGDATRFDVFLALKWNGAVMKVRNKGPAWIVYPISHFPEVNTEIFSARSVWQLKTLTVR